MKSRMYVWRVAGCLLIAAAILNAGASAAHAAWSQQAEADGTAWLWNGSKKLKLTTANNRWWHYSSIGSSWYAISTAGRPTTFIGDGGWHDLGTGFT